MKFDERARLAALWQLERSLPDLWFILQTARPPERRKPRPGLDRWDLYTRAARLEASDARREGDIAFVWGRSLLWLSAYTYTRLALALDSRRAGILFRSDEDIQRQIRTDAILTARRVMSC